MKPAPVRYVRAADSHEALAVLREHGDEAKILAGGQSLVPMMSFRLATPAVLVDLNSATGLDYIREENGHLVIGAMARQRTVETSPLTKEAVPLLSSALRHVGHVTIRNRGTIGGSLAHVDPAAEVPTAVAALRGELIVEGPGGTRTISAKEFFVGPFTSALEDEEMVVAARIPRLPEGTGTAVEELARRHGDFAVVVAVAAVKLDASGRCEFVRLGLGGANPVPLRLDDAEAVLTGAQPSGDVIEAAAEAAASAVRPMADIHAPAEYRRDMARLFVRRALAKAIDLAKGGAA